MTSDERRRDGETVEGDSDDYRSDSEADSDGYQRASESDSDGYQPGRDVTRDATGEEEEQFDEALRPLIDQWKRMRDGWWNQAGYETYWDLVKEEEARWQRMGFRSIYRKSKGRPEMRELPDASPPSLDLDAVATDATRPRRPRDRQVNVRLSELGYRALSEAAKSFGLRPSTLARLLIHRGAIAVLEDQRGRDGVNLRPSPARTSRRCR